MNAEVYQFSFTSYREWLGEMIAVHKNECRVLSLNFTGRFHGEMIAVQRMNGELYQLNFTSYTE